ncbi:glycosyltransferase family 2 protein [Lactobacillus acetotolerans]|uniref:Glycosyltransferase family 2 protein n=1 Tax=Lactobacillus acetotolerans TaxID=1600 RepID=A0A5P5ZG94_9LACO|nr:glycosyltransferase family 2 protein [Lactobacillus acetotolerans]GGV17426.1 beta-glycosyltransferase [Lactobacillus acetotolerans DSM 20749 = JCM 3825]
MFLTIFTPIYNREKYVTRLFNSIDSQTRKNFEWIIINDGSTDGTDKEINKNIAQKNREYDIRYITVKNGGKPRAINKAVQLAKGKYFFIVDSDDWLVPNAVDLINNWCDDIEHDANFQNFAGVAGLRKYPDNKINGGRGNGKLIIDATNLEREKFNLGGDKAEIYKTNLLKKYPFKIFKDENFITEGTVWNKIAADGYIIRWHMVPIYVGDYLSDGLTKNSLKRDMNNFNGLVYTTKLGLELEPVRNTFRYLYNYVEVGKAKSYSYKKLAKLIGISTYSLFIKYNLFKSLKKGKHFITSGKK